MSTHSPTSPDGDHRSMPPASLPAHDSALAAAVPQPLRAGNLVIELPEDVTLLIAVFLLTLANFLLWNVLTVLVTLRLAWLFLEVR